jgi:hypothetical protein
MTSTRVAALMMLLGAAHAAAAQSGTTPTPPVAAPAPALKAPPSAPPPPRLAPLLSAAQRTPTPSINLKAAPGGGVTPVTSVHPDSTRVAAQRASAAAIAAAAPAARVANPPRRQKATPAEPPSANRMPTAESRPIGATMRCKDGTYLTSAPSASACSANGGVAVTYPATPAPPAPRAQPQKRP